MPPGPVGHPIIGNLLSMPSKYEWLYYAKLGERHGPIVSVNVLGQPIVILNTIEACVNLLDKRSGIYSGRPKLHFAGKMVGWDRQLILCEDGERHKAMRKMFVRHIGTRETVSEYYDMQEKEARHFLVAATDDSEHILQHIRLALSAMFLKITHGYNIERESPDPLISLIEKAAAEFYIAAAPGVWLVDMFPWLEYLPQWFPGAQFKRIASRLNKTCTSQTTVPIQFVKEQLESKGGQPCFTSHILESERTPLEDEIYPYIATSLYAGGQDTVSATLGTFFLAMLLYPDVQRRAQAELDGVLGRCRLPTAPELEQLPYLQAVFKEVLRWHTVACLNLPHMTTRDDIYEGYHIPKGSIVLANLWNIANNPDMYPQPTVFSPGRFLGPSSELDPHTFVFGFGKRRCPGIELARRSCLFFMAATLAVVDIRKARSDAGEIVPQPEFVSGTVCHPKPFPCDICPRSEDAKVLLESWAEEASVAGDSAKLTL
ncbi:unnamed protein product [Peniophora sp. CBMAI 1063]|nr:unnamed protein product [Peniophora sp. CBMAI 1063]